MSSPNNAYKTYRNLSTTGATAETGILSVAVGMHRGGGVQLLGTFVGTVQFEETLDSGTTWIAKTVYPVGGGAGVTSATATGQWKFACGGSTNFRVRCSAFTSGPIEVALTLTQGVDQAALDGLGVLSALSSTDPVETYSSCTPDNMTDSGLVKTGAGTFHGLVVGAPGTTITVTVYDNTSAAGTIIFGPYVLGAAGTSIEMPGGGFTFATGLYVAFSATTGTPNISVGYR